MANQGPLSTGTGVDDASYGDLGWGGTDRITVSDDSRAFASQLGGGVTHYLKATNFGFTIPGGSSIDGIVVEIEKSSSGGDFVTDNRVRMVLADGTIGTTDKAVAAHWSTTDTYATYGSSSDTWGLAWTDGQINNPNFGVVLAANCNSSNSTALVDHVRMTVYYTAGATTTSTSASSSSTSMSSTSSSISTSSTSSSISSTSSSTSSTSSSISTSTSTSTSTTTIIAINFKPIGRIQPQILSIKKRIF